MAQPAPQPAAQPTAPPTAHEPVVEREADTAVLGEMAAGLDEPRRANRSGQDQARAARAEEQARKRQEKQEAKRAAQQEKAELKARRKQEQAEKRAAARAARAELEEEPVGGPDVEADLEAADQHESSVVPDDHDDADDDARFAPADALVARLPEIKPAYAAIISGLLAGLAAVLLAIGASKGCEAVRDNSSCGGGAGLLAIVAILAIEVLVGANLLKAWEISDPFSTSFLGVGVVATIAMLTFLDSLDSAWMLLVIPLMTAAAFAVSWWVTVKFIDEHPMASEVDSERGEPNFDEPVAEDSDQDSNA